MSEGAKRSLRDRRAPKTFDSDNQDIDPYGYGRHPYTKDLRTPSQLLNSDAKLFVKFINNANKRLKDHDFEQRRKDMENIKEPQPVRDRRDYQTQSVSQIQRRSMEDINMHKSGSSKKPKDIYNFKANAHNSDNQIPEKNEAFLNKIKTLNMQSATNMRFLQMSIVNNKPEMSQSQFQKNTGNIKNSRKVEDAPISKTMVNTQNGKRQGNQQTKNGGFFPKDKEKVKQMNELQQKLGLPKTDFSNNNKIFKRSAYHVAICYHIYLKKLREKGPIGNEIDPTYHARKLKEDMGRNA